MAMMNWLFGENNPSPKRQLPSMYVAPPFTGYSQPQKIAPPPVAIPSNISVQEIHDAFDSASEKLLKEAEEILAKLPDTSKGERMAKLGFHNTPDATKHSNINLEKNRADKLATQIRYFQTFYPNNKFITEQVVQQICNKYGLLFGDSARYIGDIPEKNLTEIENFKLLEQDMEKHTHGWCFQSGSHHGTYNSVKDKSQVPAGVDAFWGYYIQEQWGVRYVKVDDETILHTYTKPEFKICAPAKDFHTQGMKVEGYKLVQDIKDPIVLQPVIGGYLIVSKWGLEAEDPALLNPTQN